jgi:hypothetical protein
MGKRELLIVAAFIALGAVAWQLTAPPAPAGSRRFSVDTVAEIWRNRNTPRQAGHGVVVTSGTLPLSAEIAELRLSNLFAVVVEGTDRADVAWSLEAEATGPTDDVARATAQRLALQHDDMGSVLALSVRAPEDTPRTSTLTLQVPARLLVRVESARRTAITAVAGVRLENLVGDTTLRRVTGAIEGGHRNGELTIEDVEAVTLTLVGSTAVVTRPRGPVDVNARNGSTRIDAPAGRVTAEVNSQQLTIVDPAAAVRVGGIGGEIAIERPRAAIDIDARRTRVTVALDRAVPLTVFAAQGDVTVTVDDVSRVALDVIADSGRIDATGVGLAAVERDGRSMLTQAVDNAPRIAIRGERNSIVIAPVK